MSSPVAALPNLRTQELINSPINSYLTTNAHPPSHFSASLLHSCYILALTRALTCIYNYICLIGNVKKYNCKSHVYCQCIR